MKINIVYLCFASCLIFISCSPVQFTGSSQKKITEPIFQNTNIITCAPTMDSGITKKTVASSIENPTIKANCSPSDVTYNWGTKKLGSSIQIAGLTGPESQGQFYAAGPGVYEVVLTASKLNYLQYSNPSPLIVTVVPPPTPPPAIACQVGLNASLEKSIEITQGSMNPNIIANCTPADVAYQWTVSLGNSLVTIPGLTGSSSTPDFAGQNPGNYLVSFQASRSQFTNYNLPIPLQVTVKERPTRDVMTQKEVTLQDNQLDLLLVIDDSKSMLADNQRLAGKLQGFVNQLEKKGFDWQMCATLTRAQSISQTDSTLYWGASRFWVGNQNSVPYILKPNSGNLTQILTNTVTQIGAGWLGTEDERGIKAAYWHLWNGDPNIKGNSGCYRSNAGLSVIILSDEDVRSVGGDQTQAVHPSEYKPLDNDDQPGFYNNFVRQTFGSQKRFTVNSIIVRPGDAECLAQQDAEGTKSHFGNHYQQLSQLTGGYIGSICESDFSQSLNLFADKIIANLASLPLECSPYNQKVDVKVTPELPHTVRIENNQLIFNPKIPAGHKIEARYKCAL